MTRSQVLSSTPPQRTAGLDGINSSSKLSPDAGHEGTTVASPGLEIATDSELTSSQPTHTPDSPSTTLASPLIDAPTSTQPPSDTPCNHPIHPAYADTYMSPKCPACQLDRYIFLARKPTLTITTRGGRGRWREHVLFNIQGEAQAQERERYTFVTGHHKRYDKDGKDLHVTTNSDHDEIDVSFPRGKTQVLNKVTELEDVSAGEKAWEANNPPESRDEETKKQFDDARYYTATAAVARWHAHTKKAFEKVEELSAKLSRKRGREMEISAYPDFPDPQDTYLDRAYYLTQEQKDFIDAAASPDSNDAEGDRDLSTIKRKRHRLTLTVDFDTHTYVRSEADIDLLFAPPAGLTLDFLEDTHAPPPPRSILRTASQHMHPLPRRTYKVKDLETKEKSTAGHVRAHRGQARDGYEITNTSGSRYKANWDAWDAYRARLAIEAGQGDDWIDGIVRDEGDGEGVKTDESIEEDGVDEDEVPTDEEVAEVERQVQQAQQTMNELPCVRFRPHGGMASVVALGTFVGGTAVEWVRRAGIL